MTTEQPQNQEEENKKEEINYAEKYPQYKYYNFEDGSIYYGETLLIGFISIFFRLLIICIFNILFS